MENGKKTHSGTYGVMMMVAAALCFSGGGAVIKLIPWNAFAINGIRNLLAAGVFAVYIIVTRHKLKWNKTVFFGAVCMMGVSTLFIIANKMTTAGNAIILQYTAPVWIILLMLVLFHKRPTRLEVATVGIVLVGIVFFFFDSLSAGHIAGDIFAVVAGIFYAGVFILNQFETGDAISSMFFGQLACGIIESPFLAGETDFSPMVILAILFLGIVQIGLAYLCFSFGTRYTSPVTAAIVTAIEPILNPILVAVFWDEVLSPLSLVGAGIVITAVVFYNVLESRGRL